MTLSVIIPAYNDLAGVMRCLNTLRATQQGAAVEYLVQDDASPGVDLRACVPVEAAACERNEHNLGFAGNCNRAAARAHGDVLLFINQDVWSVPEWSTGWAAHLMAAFDDVQVGAAGARLLFPGGQIQSAGGWLDGRCQPIHRCFGWVNPLHEEADRARDVTWATGAALAVRRELFERAGGFDTAYINGYFEDVDLCIRIQLSGWRVRYAPAVTFIHQPGSTGGNPAYFTRNALVFKSRWVDSGTVTPDTPMVHLRYW